MSCHNQTIEALRSAGYRLTPKRITIVEAIHHLGGHVTAEQILGYVQERYPYVDISTIYRTLELLTGLHLVSTFNCEGAPTMYEVRGDPHHHLVCRQCGAVEVIACDHLNTLTSHLRDEHAFSADIDHLVLEGVCQGCLDAAAEPADIDH
jgi:Fur family ferric uptake transcriptional regulator